jgi:hypothetical protein
MKKQTAVNFLTKELINNSENDYSFAQAHKTITIDLDSFYELIEKSLLIEKEQIIDAFTNEDNIQWDKQIRTKAAEQYYNETFDL